MSFEISLVQWPADPEATAKLVVSCLLSAMRRLDAQLGVPVDESLELASRFVRGEATDLEVENVRASLWDFIHSRNGLVNFQDRDLLLARLALCLLPPGDTDRANLEEKLAFFLEVLQRLKLPIDGALAAIIEQLTPYLPT